MLVRCPWVPLNDELYVKYHDQEWGVEIHDDKILFEFLLLESFQAGLSWKTILHKRQNFKKAFANFSPEAIARFDEKDVERLMQDAGIIRNRLKIKATISNAQAFLAIQKEFGSFDKYLWQFVGNKPIVHEFKTIKDYLPYIDEALNLARDLKKRGFKFMGPTVVYAHMQATGMVNDHTIDCFKYKM